ncbi:Adrenodoxin-like protein [Leptotrombidium deliense]|uniref:Adrenodoxin-like protein n=1 Tax=Leptotrombidium deliense TaxID=299467 RepID=A0A443SUU5_9ACAR|nr:Adrenodoxin-like protein [Leptotrombidium deliense]
MGFLRNHNRFACVLQTKKDFARNSYVKQFCEVPKQEITFVKSNKEKITVTGKEGDTLLDVVVNNDVDIDGFGACEGTLCCSSCHLIFKNEDFEKLKPKASDEELDLLDLAFGLTDTSRLGCQITLNRELDGVEVIVPEGIHDARTN